MKELEGVRRIDALMQRKCDGVIVLITWTDGMRSERVLGMPQSKTRACEEVLRARFGSSELSRRKNVSVVWLSFLNCRVMQ